MVQWIYWFQSAVLFYCDFYIKNKQFQTEKKGFSSPIFRNLKLKPYSSIILDPTDSSFWVATPSCRGHYDRVFQLIRRVSKFTLDIHYNTILYVEYRHCWWIDLCNYLSQINPFSYFYRATILFSAKQHYI